MAGEPAWRPDLGPGGPAAMLRDATGALPARLRTELGRTVVAVARSTGPVAATGVALATAGLADPRLPQPVADAAAPTYWAAEPETEETRRRLWLATLGTGLASCFPEGEAFREAARDARRGDPGALAALLESYRDRDDRRERLAGVAGPDFAPEPGEAVNAVVDAFDAPSTDAALAATCDLRAALATPSVCRQALAASVAGAGEPVSVARLGAGLSAACEAADRAFEDLAARLHEETAAAAERQGFVRLDPLYFDDPPRYDPETYWRTGFTLRAVYAGYAHTREDAVADLVESLTRGTDRLVVGRPGSGKSTLCKAVACRWYRAGLGTVLYRQGDADAEFDDVDGLARAVAAAEGRVLVVVEDAVRPANDRVFEAVDALADEDVRFLLDARRSELADLDDRLRRGSSDRPRTVRRVRGEHLREFNTPGLDREECRAVVEQFESVTGSRVVEDPADLHDSVVSERGVGGDELIHLAYNLVGSGGRDDAATGLERAVEDAYDRLTDPDGPLAAHWPLARRVALAVNVLNAANVPVYRELLHALDDDHERLDAVIDALGGDLLFDPGDGDTAFKTNHELWSALYVRLLVLREPESTAREQFAGVVNALFDLADPDTRAEIERWTGGDPGADATADAGSERLVARGRPERRPAYLGAVLPAAKLVDRIADLGTRWPVLSPLYGTSSDSPLSLPEQCSAMTRARFVASRGDMHREAGRFDVAVGEYRRARELVEEADGVEPNLLAKHRVRYGNDVGTVALERGDLDEAERRYERALEGARSIRYRVGEAESLTNLGVVARKRGDLDGAERRYERALDIYRDLGSRHEGARVLKNLGVVCWDEGDYGRAEGYYERALDIYRETGGRDGEAECLNNLGVIAKRRGDVEGAETYHRRSLRIKREIGDRVGQARSLNNLGLVVQEQGDLERAAEYYERSLALKRETGDRFGQAKCLMNLGVVAAESDDLDEAETYHRQSMTAFREIGHRNGEAGSHNNLGVVARKRGDLDEAERHNRAGLELFREVGDRHGQAECLADLGAVARERGNRPEALDRLERAADLFVETASAEAVPTLRQALDVAERLGRDDRVRELCRTVLRFTEDAGLDDAHEEFQARCEHVC